jgi:AcrR family transcriptional regulator
MRTAARSPATTRASRVYRQELRARQMQANTERIVQAAVTLIKTARSAATITLEDVASESQLTVRTILRRFGSRDGILEAAFAQLNVEFASYRRPTPPGAIDEAVKTLVHQYELMGDLNIRALEEEDTLPLLHRVLTDARRYHRDWLRGVFGPRLTGLTAHEREGRITALYAATDVYLWKLLRRDLNLDRDQTEATFKRLVHGVLTLPAQARPKRRS